MAQTVWASHGEARFEQERAVPLFAVAVDDDQIVSFLHLVGISTAMTKLAQWGGREAVATNDTAQPTDQDEVVEAWQARARALGQ